MALAILAAAALVLGGGCLYAREELLNSKRFADRTVSALSSDAVRRVVAREIVTQGIDRAHPDLLAARPVITSIVEAVVGTSQFRGVARRAAEGAHRLLFHRDSNVVLSIADAGTVVISALRTLAPNLASQIPPQVDARLLDLHKRSFAVSTLRAADRIRTLALVLPLLAFVLLALSVLIANRRRAAITRCALALAVVGVAVFADLALLRHNILVHLFGAEELSNGEVRAAAGALWDSYLGDLSHWALGLAIAGAILAAVSARVVRPYAASAEVARLRRALWPMRTRATQVLIGCATLILGVLMIVRPTLVIDSAAVLCGVALLYLGAGELLSGLGAAPVQERPTLARARFSLVVVAGSLAALIGGPAIALATDGGSDSRPPTLAPLACNGYAQLCSRRVDQVVFAGTHNSMSAADSPGWLIANQSRDIAQQLNDGIRAFKISTHYGISDGRGHVLTDLAASGERVNRVSENLSPEGRAALQRLSASIGFGSPQGKPSVWLCHTQCEVGATSMSSFLGTVARFLKDNPAQVLIFFDEDYVSEDSLEAEFKRAGLLSRLEVLTPGQPLPTLGALVASQHNVLVFAQEPVSGKHPWDMPGFDWIQDTPLGAVKPSQFNCRVYRGRSSNPLLMMNNWADVFPPRRGPNLALNKRAFILQRARQCEAERHQIPNVILFDFYDSGDVIAAVATLNGLGGEPPAPVVPVRG